MQEKNVLFGKISENIRAACQRVGFNQNQLAQAANISHVTVSRYMSDARVPGTEELYRMAHVLGVSMEYLLTGEETGLADVWQKRALEAERKMTMMKNLVGKLGDLTKDLTTIVSE